MMDDSGVTVIGAMPFAEGWKVEAVRVRGRGADVFVSPQGVRYVIAMESERADLIYHRTSRHFPEPLHVRLRLEQGSALSKRQRKEERQTARGERQLEQKATKTKKVRRKQ